MFAKNEEYKIFYSRFQNTALSPVLCCLVSFVFCIYVIHNFFSNFLIWDFHELLLLRRAKRVDKRKENIIYFHIAPQRTQTHIEYRTLRSVHAF